MRGQGRAESRGVKRERSGLHGTSGSARCKWDAPGLLLLRLLMQIALREIGTRGNECSLEKSARWARAGRLLELLLPCRRLLLLSENWLLWWTVRARLLQSRGGGLLLSTGRRRRTHLRRARWPQSDCALFHQWLCTTLRNLLSHSTCPTSWQILQVEAINVKNQLPCHRWEYFLYTKRKENRHCRTLTSTLVESY